MPPAAPGGKHAAMSAASPTWTEHRALAFARGLLHVAQCDGLDAVEARAVEGFLRLVGQAETLDELAALPFDPSELKATLDSVWLRRTLIQACRRMVALDGRVSPAERDTLRGLASALGVGERLALAGLEELPAGEDFGRWIAGLAVDHVAWDDEVQAGYFWLFPHPTHPIAEGATLVVERGQALVVRHGEIVCDVLGPGDHTATPSHLPGLARTLGWTGGEFFADLLFIRTGPSPRLRWGTSTPVPVRLPGHGVVDLSIFGRFSVRFHDVGLVADRMARRTVPDSGEVEQRLRTIMTGRFATVLAAQSDLTIELLNDLDALATHMREALDAPLSQSGLFLARLEIENLTGPSHLGLKPTSKRTQNLTQAARVLMGQTSEQPVKADLVPCIRCGISLPTSARFCTSCGTPQRKRCVSCGGALPPAARFCSQCGTGQPA